MTTLTYAVDIDLTGLTDAEATKVRDKAVKGLNEFVESFGMTPARWTPLA